MSDPCDSTRRATTGGDTPAAEAARTDPQPRSVAVETVVHDSDWSEFAQFDAMLAALTAALASEIDLGDVPLSAALALSSDARVRDLNREYRGKDTPTNVLSFPASEGASGDDGSEFLGDVILARETVAAGALERGIPFVHHVQHLVLHGLLHLAGFDHETPDEAEEMESIEIAVLARLGIANPYEEETAATG